MAQSPSRPTSPIKKGDPISKPGFAKDYNDMRNAIYKMEIVGENGITCRIEWANGIPRLIVRLDS